MQGILGSRASHWYQVQVRLQVVIVTWWFFLCENETNDWTLLPFDRKYLEHMADVISDWTREEELKREAIQNTSSGESTRGSDNYNWFNTTRTNAISVYPEPDADQESAEEDTLEPFIRKESLKVRTNWRTILHQTKSLLKLRKNCSTRLPLDHIEGCNIMLCFRHIHSSLKV